jgi:hypothetical protein
LCLCQWDSGLPLHEEKLPLSSGKFYRGLVIVQSLDYWVIIKIGYISLIHPSTQYGDLQFGMSAEYGTLLKNSLSCLSTNGMLSEFFHKALRNDAFPSANASIIMLL